MQNDQKELAEMATVEVLGVNIELADAVMDDLIERAKDEGVSLDAYLDRKVGGKWAMHAHEGADTMLSIKDVLEIDCIGLAGEI